MGKRTGYGDRLRELRKAAGLTLEALADRVGIHFTTVAKIESGDRAPSLRMAETLAEALGTTVGAMLGEKCRPVRPRRKD